MARHNATYRRATLMVDDRKSPQMASTHWNLYFVSFWWVFAAAATIGIILVTGLYYELATGIHLVEWCSTTCAMIGVLVVALWIMLAHWLHGDRERIATTTQELNDLKTRLRFLEEAPDRIERNENDLVVFMGDPDPKGGSDD
jgi:hypothetical protein